MVSGSLLVLTNDVRQLKAELVPQQLNKQDISFYPKKHFVLIYLKLEHESNRRQR